MPFVLRDYRSGDALRQVNWKTSAKRQRLIVKEMEEEANEGDLFSLSGWPTFLNQTEMERFISFVASLIFTTHERNHAVGLATPERLFKPEHSRANLNRILEYLAFVDPSAPSGPPAAAWRTPPNLQVADVLSLWKSYTHEI